MSIRINDNFLNFCRGVIFLRRSLKWLAVLTTIGMLFVLIGGALVTKTGSGMGCGRSWPLCNGEFVPTDITAELLIELAHRLVSGTVGIMVLVLSVWTWKAIGHIRETKFLSFLSFFFLVLQGLIGAAAVLWGQNSFVLALHFGISLISFAAVLLLTLLIFEVDKKFEAEKLIIDKRMQKHIIGVTIYSYIVVYTGALVRHKKASLVCSDWPLCNNDSFILPTNFNEWVQMGHRFFAALIFLWIGYITILAIKNYKHQKVIYWGWIISFLLVCLQVIAGALIVVSKLNLYIALAHAFLISCLFGLLCYFILLTSRSKKNALEQGKNQTITKQQTTTIL
jgi:heme a synthase